MYGSPQQQAAMASNLNDLATNLYGSQYNNDMNRQLQAGSVLGNIAQGERQQQISGIGLTPSLVGGQIANYQGLLGAGQYQDTYNHNAYMNPLSMIQGYQNVIATGNSGGVNSQPYYTNPTAGVLGSAALGLDAYRTFSGSGSGGGYVNPISDPYASLGGPSERHVSATTARTTAAARLATRRPITACLRAAEDQSPMGLLDGDYGGDASGGGSLLSSPLSLIGLSLLANSGPSRVPHSVGADLGQAVLSAQQLGQQNALQRARLGLLGQEARAATTANDLNDINLAYYQRRQAAGAGVPTRAPMASLLGGTVAPAPGGVSPLSGGAIPATGGAAPMAGGVAPAMPGGGFLLDPSSVLAQAQDAMSVPALKDQATQYLKLYEQMINKGTGARADGSIAPFTGAPESAYTMAHAEELGKTLAGNNKDQIVGPSAALLSGPRTLAEYQASLAPGSQTKPNYINPMSPQNITLNTGKTLAEVAVDQAGHNLGDSQKTAQSAADLLPTLQRAQQLVPQVFSGPGANLQMQLSRVLNPSDPRLAATAEYLRTVGSQVGNLARQVGGTQISDADRKTAEKLAGGDLSVTQGELNSVLSAAQKAAQTTIDTHNARAGKYVNAAPKEVQDMLRATTTVDTPPGYTPQQAAGGAAAGPAKALDDTTRNAAQNAIMRGAPRDSVLKRLQENGFDVSKF
jgi:hypothetical protein